MTSSVIALTGFGGSVSGDLGDIDGDGFNDIAVAAPSSDIGVTDGGALFIFFMNANDTVREHTVLVPGTGGAFEGASSSEVLKIAWATVALWPRSPGNPVDIAVRSAGDEGGVLLFRLASNGTVIPGSIESIGNGLGGMPSGSIAAGSGFGQAGKCGDLDGDGVEDLLVGAQTDGTGGTDSGAVYILYLTSGGSADPVRNFTKLTVLSPGLSGVVQPSTRMHVPAAIGDLDGDGVTDIIIGADRDSSTGEDRGSAIIMFMGGAVPSPSPSPIPSHAVPFGGIISASAIRNGEGGLDTGTLEELDRFGRSVASLGDLDSDGITDLAIGAMFDDTAGTNKGTIYVCFMQADGSIDRYHLITANYGGFNASLSREFGAAMASHPEGQPHSDGPNLPRLYASERAYRSNTGAVHVMRMNSTGHVHSQTLLADGLGGIPIGTLAIGDRFGYEIGSLGDMNGDDCLDIAVTAD